MLKSFDLSVTLGRIPPVPAVPCEEAVLVRVGIVPQDVQVLKLDACSIPGMPEKVLHPRHFVVEINSGMGIEHQRNDIPLFSTRQRTTGVP